MNENWGQVTYFSSPKGGDPQLGDRKRGNRRGDDFANTSANDLFKIYRGNKSDPRWLRAKEELKARGLVGSGEDGGKKKPPKPPGPPKPPNPPKPPDPPNPKPPDPPPPPTKDDGTNTTELLKVGDMGELS